MGQSRLDDPRDDLRALRFAAFDGLLDDLAVRLRGDSTAAACSSGTRRPAYAVQVYFVGLGGFVIDDSGDIGDVEAAGGEVRCEEVGGLGGAEGREGGYSLMKVLVDNVEGENSLRR